MNRMLAASFAIAVVLGGCSTQIGPRTVAPAHYAYNQAMVRSWDEQMLLNLVRLRYRDNPLFLQVTNVLADYSVSVGVGVSGSFDFDGNNSGGATGSAGYGESPTITYRPLQGDEFVESLLTPIRPETLILLSRSGWSIERLLLCCVQRLNDLENGIAAAGPTPDYVPDFERFHAMAGAFRQLQKEGQVRVVAGPDRRLRIRIEGEGARDLLERLGLRSGSAELVTEGSPPPEEGVPALHVTGRSLLAVMFFLSQGVEPPPDHVERGLVTSTRDDEGRAFDWSRVTGGLIRVRSSPRRPVGAAVAVPYRDHWFYVEDDDLNSKTTFSLLNYLFILKSGAKAGEEPLLTLGVG